MAAEEPSAEPLGRQPRRPTETKTVYSRLSRVDCRPDVRQDPPVDAELGRPLWAEVFDLLRSEIERQGLRPGERLLEVELAERFGVSRGPVRAALVELERVGLVKINPRRGAYVAALTARDADELYELRSALEVAALHGVLRRCSKSRIAELATPTAAGRPRR